MGKEIGFIKASEINIRGGNETLESIGTSVSSLKVFKKNTAKTIVFPIYDNDGDTVVNAASLDSEISKDGGAFTDCSNEAVQIGTTNGIYSLLLTANEMNADVIAVVTKTTTTDAKSAVSIIYTTS